MITTASLRTQRAGFTARLWMSCRGDLAAYGDGVIGDFRTLTADAIAAWLVVAVVVSQLADAASTMLALANNWPEGNPLSASVIARWGVPGLLTEKVVIATVVVVNMARLRGRTGKVLGFLAVLIGFGAVVWNLHVIG
ncbi:MAG: DUF5658 family protein [Candidatus Dormibacteria bacterium]